MSFQKEVTAFINREAGEPIEADGPRIFLPDSSTLLMKGLSDHIQPQPGERVIWKDQWVNKRPIVESRLNSVMGNTTRIYARNTRVVSLPKPEADTFLIQNHLLGATGCKTKLGLTYREEVVAVATFSGPARIDRAEGPYRSYELIRYCPLLSHTIVGGLSKLIHHFIAEKQPDDIMTYVDREWSGGTSYLNLGFRMVEETTPQHFWVNSTDLTRHHQLPSNGSHDRYIEIQNQGSYKFILFLK